MKISKNSAQQIVEEIGKLVRQNINLMDETGHIIASNDPARIGIFHTGAYRIIQNRLKEYYITPELEAELPDVRRGINLPIEVDGEVQGVIGITGDYSEVIKYGQIVKKMAEILIRDRVELDNRQLDQRVRSRFLEDWILGTGLSNPQALSERGFALGIDVRSPRRCVVVSARNREQYIGSLEGQLLLERLEGMVSARILEQRGIILRNAACQILLLRRQDSGTLGAPLSGNCPGGGAGTGRADDLRHRRSGRGRAFGLPPGQPGLAHRRLQRCAHHPLRNPQYGAAAGRLVPGQQAGLPGAGFP